jgi:hypothetical protein
MTKSEAARLAARLRETHNCSSRVVPDISTGNEGRWGVQIGEQCYWDRDEVLSEMGRSDTRTDPDDMVTLTLSRRHVAYLSAITACELQVRGGSPGQRQLFQDIQDEIGRAWRK